MRDKSNSKLERENLCFRTFEMSLTQLPPPPPSRPPSRVASRGSISRMPSNSSSIISSRPVSGTFVLGNSHSEGAPKLSVEQPSRANPQAASTAGEPKGEPLVTSEVAPANDRRFSNDVDREALRPNQRYGTPLRATNAVSKLHESYSSVASPSASFASAAASRRVISPQRGDMRRPNCAVDWQSSAIPRFKYEPPPMLADYFDTESRAKTPIRTQRGAVVHGEHLMARSRSGSAAMMNMEPIPVRSDEAWAAPIRELPSRFNSIPLSDGATRGGYQSLDRSSRSGTPGRTAAAAAAPSNGSYIYRTTHVSATQPQQNAFDHYDELPRSDDWERVRKPADYSGAGIYTTHRYAPPPVQTSSRVLQQEYFHVDERPSSRSESRSRAHRHHHRHSRRYQDEQQFVDTPRAADDVEDAVSYVVGDRRTASHSGGGGRQQTIDLVAEVQEVHERPVRQRLEGETEEEYRARRRAERERRRSLRQQ